MIRGLENQYNAEYIANYFWKNEIAKVSSVTILPYILDGIISNIAYIEIDNYCESESAAEFIRNITGVVPYMVAHAEPEEENIWILEHNTHNDGVLCVGNFTTMFSQDFFEVKDKNSKKSYEDKVPYKGEIKGLKNDYYDLEEAWSHLIYLNDSWDTAVNDIERCQIAKAIHHFEIEIQKHIATEENKRANNRREIKKTAREAW